MPDASPLTQKFLSSLANFMAQEHDVIGEGDISPQVKVAIERSKAENRDALGPIPNAGDRSNSSEKG